tara:strand:- start:140 stop:367 length:228 start_codon:yes stop_codon:yes gene_type:complete
MNLFEECEAPPIKKPSISEIEDNKPTFLGLTEPPYKTLKFLFLKIFFDSFLIKIIFFINSLILGTLFVPIAQTGS